MNKENKYMYIKKFLNLENYNKHTYYTPKWMKIFKIPKSYKTEYAGKWNEDEVFQTCVEKIWDKLCIEDNFELQSIGDLDLIKNEEWKLELISALMNQIEYMVFNNTIIDSVNMNGYETGNITKGRVHSNFWYDEPYNKLWVIGFFTGKSLQDFIDLDWTPLATRKYIRDIAKLIMENFEDQFNGFVDENIETISTKVANELKTNQQFLTDLKDEFKNDKELLKYFEDTLEPIIYDKIKTDLPKDEEFLNEILTHIPPMSTELFNELLIKDKSYVADKKALEDRITILETLIKDQNEFNKKFKLSYENFDLDTTKK